MTDFLYARPSVLEGMGRNIDLFGILSVYNTSESGREADLKARLNDIEALRKDYAAVYDRVINGNSL